MLSTNLKHPYHFVSSFVSFLALKANLLLDVTTAIYTEIM